jgi:pantetheine-phosphate adenylyltransferase
MLKVLYPGSFDPITKGHMNIIEQASKLFDEVVIAVLTNDLKKNGLFLIDERLKMIKDIYSDKLLDNKNVYMRKRFLLIFCQKWPELKVSSEDIEYVINYLESIEIMQKLNE